jgi:hypothetical protein
VKYPRGAPDHADGDEQQDVCDPGRHRRRDDAAEPPQRAGKSADQIRRSPPGQRLDAILHPREQQKKSEQRGDAGCDDK